MLRINDDDGDDDDDDDHDDDHDDDDDHDNDDDDGEDDGDNDDDGDAGMVMMLRINDDDDEDDEDAEHDEDDEDDEDDGDDEDNNAEDEVEDDKLDDDGVEEGEEDDVEKDNVEEGDDKDDNVAEDEVEDHDVAEDEMKAHDVAEDEVEDDDVEDDDVKGEEDDFDVEKEDDDDVEWGWPIQRHGPTLCASLRSRKALQRVTRATWYGKLQEECRAPEWAQNADTHFVRACAVDTHVNISQEPPSTEIYRKNAAAQTLCEPVQSKRMSTFHKNHFIRKFTGKCRAQKPRRRLCASLHSRNACQHFTRATLYGKLQGKGARPEWAPWSSTGLYTYRKNASVWTHYLGTEKTINTLLSQGSKQLQKRPPATKL